MTPELQDKLRQIKLVVLDVDGILTDDAVYIGPEGLEFKRFSLADGLGMHIAKRNGIKIAFLSGRHSPATQARADELGIEDVFMKPENKLVAYNQLKDKYNLSDDQIAYMGNDLIDIGVMKQCGLAATVPDSPRTVQQVACYITEKRGGFGAVRELLDTMLEARGIREEDRIA